MAAPPEDASAGPDAGAAAAGGGGVERSVPDAARLDVALTRMLGVSRREARQLLEAGAVRVDGRTARDGGRRVPRGACLACDPAALRPAASAAGAVRVLQETAAALVVEKPAGLPVHPLRPDEADTLLQRLMSTHPEVAGAGDEGPLRGGTVHRLDTETSGCVVFARDVAAWRRLREAFAQHRIEKHYTALVAGSGLAPGWHTAHLAVVRHRPAAVAVVDATHPDARRCDLEVLSAQAVQTDGRGPVTRLEIALGTGFLHQIRVMLAHLGHPVLGDARYGGGGGGRAGDTLHLHAHRLRLPAMGIDAACDPPW